MRMRMMTATKRIPALVIALGVAIAGAAACDDDPNGPGNTIVFTATMSSANEVPPVSNAEAGATGTATLTFNLTRGANDVITAATVDFTSTVSNMPAGSSLTRAHIHTGAAGVAGGVLVDTGLTPAAAIPIVNGAGTLTFNGVGIDATVAQNIIDNPAGFYFNVHSVLNPGGVVRGQLVRRNN